MRSTASASCDDSSAAHFGQPCGTGFSEHGVDDGPGGLNPALVAVVIGDHRRHRLVDTALRLGPGPITLIKP